MINNSIRQFLVNPYRLMYKMRSFRVQKKRTAGPEQPGKESLKRKQWMDFGRIFRTYLGERLIYVRHSGSEKVRHLQGRAE